MEEYRFWDWIVRVFMEINFMNLAIEDLYGIIWKDEYLGFRIVLNLIGFIMISLDGVKYKCRSEIVFIIIALYRLS